MLDAPASAGDQHRDEALAILIGDQNSSEAERADLTQTVDLLAGYLKDDLKEPRPKKVYDDLDNIADLAGQLERQFRRLDPRTLGLLFQETSRTYAPELAVKVSALMSGGLAAIAETARHVREALPQMAGRDKGGPTTLNDRLRGEAPRAWLVRHCAMLLADCRGFEAISGTTGGELHRLSLAVWLYATGDGREPALDRYVKNAAVEIKKRLAGMPGSAKPRGHRKKIRGARPTDNPLI